MQSGGGRRTRDSGSCAADGERWTEGACNGKVIGAQYFVDGFGADRIAAAEYLSPRDGTGHGSHVAATAAGNSGVAVTIGKQSFGRCHRRRAGCGPVDLQGLLGGPDPSDDGCTQCRHGRRRSTRQSVTASTS